MIENIWDESRYEDIRGCKVRGLDDGLATGFEDKLRERRAKRISSDSDALLVILSEIDDTYRTRTRMASLCFDPNLQYWVLHIHANCCPNFLR